MFRLKAWVRAFFGFSKRETNAFLILLPLMVVVLFSEPVYRHWQGRQKPDLSKDARELDSIVATLKFVSEDSIMINRPSLTAATFFAFDPNVISESDFLRLGLSSFMSERIARYRSKGGKFKKKEDLLKIYGMDSSWYQKAEPWISIAALKIEERPLLFSEKERKPKLIERADINTADTIQLTKIYGIGPALSKRICTFRDRLGGFVSMDQLKEVYGLDTTVVKELNKRFFIASDFIPPKINLNTLNAEVKHPYIKRKEAQAIVAYRLQHGDIQSVGQLSEIKALSKEWIEKVQHYVSFE